MNPRYLYEHMDSTEWWIQPLASLVSEMRQLETCQMICKGLVKSPFLQLINGKERDINRLLLQQEQQQLTHENGNEVGLPSPTSVVELDIDYQRGWNIPKLNSIQEEAATNFINSKNGTI